MCSWFQVFPSAIEVLDRFRTEQAEQRVSDFGGSHLKGSGSPECSFGLDHTLGSNERFQSASGNRPMTSHSLWDLNVMKNILMCE